MSHEGRTIVLASGGIDSSCLIAFLASEYSPLEALFVDYGQLAATNELTAVAAIASHFQVPLRTLALSQSRPKSEGLIRGRNALLIALALAEFGSPSGIIAIGVHTGTSYPDCSESFLSLMQNVADIYYGGAVQIIAPFLRWTKRDIWRYAQDTIPLSLTYSCERGLPQPCGGCLSCSDLEYLSARTQKHDTK